MKPTIDYRNQGDFESRANGRTVYFVGRTTEAFLRESDGALTWRLRSEELKTERADGLPAEAGQQIAESLLWMLDEVEQIRVWMGRESARATDKTLEALPLPILHKAHSSLYEAEPTRDAAGAITTITLPCDYGKLVWHSTGSAEWRPGGLSDGEPVTVTDIPVEVLQEAFVSLSYFVNASIWAHARLEEQRAVQSS